MATNGSVWQKKLLSTFGLLLVLAMLVLANLLLAGTNLRLDATAEGLYSLSQGSRQILKELEEPVTIKFYFSRQGVPIPEYIKVYGRRVEDFLEEYRNAAPDKIRIERIDPRPDSEEQDWAQKYGVQGLPLPSGETVFFGLVVLGADQEAALPFLDPTRETQLEYDLTRAIERVQSPARKKIGVISSLPVFGLNPRAMGMPAPGQEMQPWLFLQELRKSYDVEELNPAEARIAPAIDLLILVQPEGVEERFWYAVDQYLLGGGRLLLFIDPMTTMGPPRGPAAGAEALGRLLAAWGLRHDGDRAVADFAYATRLRGPGGQIENNPFWLSLQAEAFNAENIISAQIENMLLPVAGALSPLPESPHRYESLLRSSPQAALESSFKARAGVEALRRDFKPGQQALDLAALVRGRFKTAFPQGAPPPAKDALGEAPAPPAAPHLAEARAESAVVIAADADLLFDGYSVEQQSFLGLNLSRVFNDNLNFVLNAVEMLSGSEALISLRTRGRFERPFTRVQALEARARSRWLDREQALMRMADEANARINALQKQKESSQKFVLSKDQEAELQKFRDEKIRINRELKEVRRSLNAEIEALGNRLKFANLLLVPALVALAGLGYAWRRNRRGDGGRARG
jgi:ABC-type uncharacterized transport system involved in gliding motility auxiliary subunit